MAQMLNALWQEYNISQALCLNIGIKHDFLCINICCPATPPPPPHPTEGGVETRAWKARPEPERRGFQYLPRGPADVNVSEKHVWSLLLHKTFFSLENFEETASKSSLIVWKSMLPVNVSGQRLTSSLQCTLLMMPYLNQRYGEYDRRKWFHDQSPRKNVAGPEDRTYHHPNIWRTHIKPGPAHRHLKFGS